ncbi:MAG: tRNA (guanosine(46)-N7)-methyltransferase TrmB [Gammaproteobacteria bacterium]|jgi:tRNA (guanine-N7-)-methyltransferase
MENTRRVRSFVRREGRMTPAQRAALARLWPRYGVEPEGLLDLDALFGRRVPRTLEIGFGNGASLLAMAQAEPGHDFLGIEVHRPGVGRLLRELDAHGLTNVRVLAEDATEVLEHHLPDQSLDRVLLFFPDPWPKKRHHKRRIVQPAFAALVRRKLRVGGRFHMATDWEDYAIHMLEVMEQVPGLRNVAGPGSYAPRPEYRIVTHFEARGTRLGHRVWDLVYERVEMAEDD